MKADTFAKLTILEALIEAEIGYLVAARPASGERFREGMVARVSDLVDEIDALDAVTAGRVYDAVVDFLAELPEDPPGAVEATVRFRRALDRVVDRSMDPRALAEPATWAVVLDEVLAALGPAYRRALRTPGEVHPRPYRYARTLLMRARVAADAMLRLGADAEVRAELHSALDRLAFAVDAQQLRPAAVDALLRPLQRIARRNRPSPLTRVGTFVIGHLLRRKRRSQP